MRLSKLEKRRRAQDAQAAFNDLRKAVIQGVPCEYRGLILTMLNCRAEVEIAKLGGLPPSLRR